MSHHQREMDQVDTYAGALRRYRNRTLHRLYIIIGILFFLVAWLLNETFPETVALQYFCMWLGVGIVSLYFMRYFSLTGRLLKAINLFEVSSYVTVMMLGLNASFGLFPLLDHSLLIAELQPAEMLNGLLAVGVSVVSFWAGYIAVAIPRPLKITNSIFNPKYFTLTNPSYYRTIAIYIILSLFRLYLILGGSGGQFQGDELTTDSTFNQLVYYILQYKYFFVGLISIQYAKHQGDMFTFIGMLLIEVAFAMLTGWSSDIIKLAVIAGSAIMLYHKRVNVLYIVIGAAIAIYVVPLIRDSRSLDTISVASITQQAISNENVDFQSRTDFVLNLLQQRQGDASQIAALIVTRTPDPVPYRPINELLFSPFAFIPRSLWPDKPAYGSIGQYTAFAYLGVANSGSSAVTPAGGLYIYGGYPVVILGMLFAGLFSGLLSRFLLVSGLTEGKIVLLALYIAIVVRVFHLAEGSFLSVVSTIIQTTVVFTVLTILLYFKYNNSNKISIGNRRG